MQKLLHHLRAAAILAGLLLIGLLSSCGEPTSSTPEPEDNNPTPPDLSSLVGSWADSYAFVEACDERAPRTVWFSFEKVGETLQAKGVLLNTRAHFGTEAHFGTFAGEVNALGKVSGQARFEQSAGDLVRNFDVDLQMTGTSVIGTLMNDESVQCLDGTTSERTLNVSLEPARNTPLVFEDDALEPNDESARAVNLPFNNELSLVLADEDWFTFTLTEDQIFSVDFSASSDHFAVATIYDASLNFVNDLGLSSSPSTTFLEAGSYYLKLASSEPIVTAYRLRTEHAPVPDAALEPNDSKDVATPIKLNTASQEMYLSYYDEDWFTFSLDKPHRVAIAVNGDLHCNFTGTDNVGETNGPCSSSFLDRSVGPGTFYLRVTRGSRGASFYSFSVYAYPHPDNDLEPNDTLEQATDTTLPFTDTLRLFWADEDWFTFELTEEQLVTFDFSANSEGYFSYFKGVLYESGGTELDTFEASSDNSSYAVRLTPGQYALRLYEESLNEPTFDLSISSQNVIP